jgi:hypothetical protein
MRNQAVKEVSKAARQPARLLAQACLQNKRPRGNRMATTIVKLLLILIIMLCLVEITLAKAEYTLLKDLAFILACGIFILLVTIEEHK